MSDTPPPAPADLLADVMAEVEETAQRLADLVAEARDLAATAAGSRTSPEA